MKTDHTNNISDSIEPKNCCTASTAEVINMSENGNILILGSTVGGGIAGGVLMGVFTSWWLAPFGMIAGFGVGCVAGTGLFAVAACTKNRFFYHQPSEPDVEAGENRQLNTNMSNSY